MGDPLNLSSILSEMMDVNDVVGCGFGDRNGLTLVLEGQISSNDIAEGVGFATRERGERDNVSWSNYRANPQQTLIATYITDELYLVRLHQT